jgi:hypothetical protein
MEKLEQVLRRATDDESAWDDTEEKVNERKEKAAAAKKIADARETPEFKKAVLAGDTVTMDRILATAGDKDAIKRMSEHDAKQKAAEARGIGKKVTPEAANEMRDQWVSLNRKPPSVWERKTPKSTVHGPRHLQSILILNRITRAATKCTKTSPAVKLAILCGRLKPWQTIWKHCVKRQENCRTQAMCKP